MDVRRISGYWPFGLLCAVLASRWALADAWPDSVSSLSSLALALAIAAVVAGLVALKRRHSGDGRRLDWRWALAGASLFAGINAALPAGNASPRPNDLMIALALTPVVIAVALVSRGEARGGLSGMDIAPGLMAPAGLLLILAQPRFRSVAETIVLFGAPLFAGLGAVWLSPRDGEEFTPWHAALSFAGPAVLFGTVALTLQRTRPGVTATALDLLVVVLTVWSVARLGARRFSAQFALVPLLLLLEGLLLTLVPAHVWPTWQQAGGLVLLLAAAVLLLRPRPPGDSEGGRLFS